MSDIPAEDGPADRELPSDFLRGQFRQWMDDAVAAGKTRDLFELEMWLRSFERFLRIKNQPLSEKQAKQLALRHRHVRRSPVLAILIDKKFKPVHDRIPIAALASTIRGIADPIDRKHGARVFLELFRLLHYLEYADPAHTDEDRLKNSILIFSL